MISLLGDPLLGKHHDIRIRKISQCRNEIKGEIPVPPPTKTIPPDIDLLSITNSLKEEL